MLEVTPKPITRLNYRLCVAPMMAWTDRHCRYFHRLLAPNAILYTEMVTAAAVVHGDRSKLLNFNQKEQPVALQLGGSDPALLLEAAQIAEQWGYREVNLNLGCPSDRVQKGRFGACLMLEPELVARCFQAMNQGTSIPITVKIRIGVDDRDQYSELCEFVSSVSQAGCSVFHVHARKALLSGLSPKQNRDIPPLMPELVYRLKRDFPALTLVINGGIVDLEQIDHHLKQVDGVMIGRAAYHNPMLLYHADRQLFSSPDQGLMRARVVEQMIPYIDAHLAEGGKLHHISRHLLGLFLGQPKAKMWRRIISQHSHLADANSDVLVKALDTVLAC